MKHLLLSGVLCLIAAVSLRAETVLLDFEDPADLKPWHDEGRTSNHIFPVSREARYATSGEHSLCLRTPQWKSGTAEWPAVEYNPAVKDWSEYDRLVLDMTNPTAYDQKLFFFLSDSQVATRRGLLTSTGLTPRSYTQIVVELAKVKAQAVNLKDVHVLHFFTERPVSDMEVYLDRLTLLKAGEPLPVPAAAFIKSIAGMQQEQLAALRQFQRAARERVNKVTVGTPAVAVWAEKLLAENEARIATFAEQVAQGDPQVLQSAQLITDLRLSTARMESLVALRAEFEGVRQVVQVGPAGRSDILVGFASSMEKILPRAGTPAVKTTRTASLTLARNEKEALQVVVLPVEAAAQRVAVRVGDLRGPEGTIFAAKNVDTAPLGYVQTKHVPPYGSSHVGWWPDPILDFMNEANIAVGDVQSFWVRFRAPKGQASGTYRGQLEVTVAGKPLYAFDLTVEIYPFTLPDRSPLDMAITFSPMFYEPNSQGGWREGAYPDRSWHEHKLEWGDFLADYYITYDSLYHRGDLSWDVLQRLHDQGRLGRFNLGYYGAMPEKPEEQEAWKHEVAGYIGKNYARAKELGLLDHAYIYGCDENPEAMFPGVERAAAHLKQQYPGALILTTTYDHSFGTKSVLQSMDGFCPLTPSYKRDLADKVRATGKQVWWYTCCGPHHPFLNTFIEYPAIDGRLLMGAQTVKHRPDGYLYYEISIWNGRPITSGPFTDYDPRSWTTYHGDGSWTCPGPGGTPLATIRLENFRDGLEDYAYAKLLEDAVRQVKANATLRQGREKWLTTAEALLAVPDSVAKSMTEYTRDPADVYRWRRGMAEAIKDAGATPTLRLTW
jgi:hypothetical protein